MKKYEYDWLGACTDGIVDYTSREFGTMGYSIVPMGPVYKASLTGKDKYPQYDECTHIVVRVSIEAYEDDEPQVTISRFPVDVDGSGPDDTPLIEEFIPNAGEIPTRYLDTLTEVMN